MLKSGFKSSELYAIAGYVLTQKLSVNPEAISAATDGIITSVGSVQDPLSQILVAAYVAYRFYMKWVEAKKSAL